MKVIGHEGCQETRRWFNNRANTQSNPFEGTVKLTKTTSFVPQDIGLKPVVNPPYWASETAVSLNLTVSMIPLPVGVAQ